MINHWHHCLICVPTHRHAYVNTHTHTHTHTHTRTYIYIYIYILSNPLHECDFFIHTVTRYWAFVELMCVGASQRIPLSVLARNPHKWPAHEISHETRSGWKKGRSVKRQKKWIRREKKRSVGLREQSREWEGHSQQKSAWLVAFVGFSPKYTLVLAHRMHKNCHGIPLIGLGANPSPCLFVYLFVLFFHPLSCLLCVHKQMCNTPDRKWEKPLDYLI